MSAKVISIKEFNEKIRMYIPFHEVSSPPRLGDVEGKNRFGDYPLKLKEI